MFYHKFPNLQRFFQKYSTKKLTKNIKSTDSMNLSCNFSKRTTINKEFIYGGKCRKLLVTYKEICNNMGNFYIGNTQQMLKKRIDTHLGEVCKQINKSKSSNTFTKYFVSLFLLDSKITRKDSGWNSMARKSYFICQVIWKTHLLPMYEEDTTYTEPPTYGPQPNNQP